MSDENPNHLINGYVHNEPFEVSKLQVSSIHTLYYEQFGSKTGLPGKILSHCLGLPTTYRGIKKQRMVCNTNPSISDFSSRRARGSDLNPKHEIFQPRQIPSGVV